VRTLIVGGTGCGGRALARTLTSAGHRVRVLARGLTPHPPLPAGADAVLVDRHDARALAAALDDFGPEFVVDQIAYEAAEAETLRRALPSSVRRVVTVSSAVVYEGAPAARAGRTDAPHEEADPLVGPGAPAFALGKGAAERAALEDPRAIVVRLGLLFGPGHPPLTPLGRAADLRRRLEAGEALPVPADDPPRLQPLFAGDFAEVVLRLLDAPAFDPRPAVLNVTGGDTLDWPTWLQAWATAWGTPPPRVEPCTPAELAHRAPPWLTRFLPALLAPPRLDTSRLRSILPDWRPTPTVEAVRATVRAAEDG
jgi:nucleoside-diphosphate-sugar epimerase